MAVPSLAAAELPVIELSIKPRLCVLTEGEESCYDELEVKWTAPQPLSLCLYRDGVDQPLTCWSNVAEGRHRFAVSTRSDIHFHLREPDADTLLVSEAFEVIQDHKKYRRARRNSWSFF